MTGNDLKKLAIERLADAKHLLSGGRYDAAGYLCGYVLEMALKACVCKRLRIQDYPERNDSLGKAFKTHSVEDLLLLAGLKDQVSAKRHQSLANWSVVSVWKSDWRYRPYGSVSRKDAEDMIRVLSQEVLPWLKKRW